MNSLPAADRGAGGGMNSTFQNSAQVFSIGIFFTLMIAGLSVALPHTMSAGLTAHGVPVAAAARIARCPPVSMLFATFLGYNPVEHLVGSAAARPASGRQRPALTGRSFFPNLISGPSTPDCTSRSGFHRVLPGRRGGEPVAGDAVCGGRTGDQDPLG